MAKYPKVVIDLPTVEEIQEWLREMEKNGRNEESYKILTMWMEKFKEWEQGKWGKKNWDRNEAYRRAGAYARGKYHYTIGKKRMNELSNKLKKSFSDDFEKFKKLKTQAEKMKFIEDINDRSKKSSFSAYTKASRIVGRGMDLMKSSDLGEASQPTPDPEPIPLYVELSPHNTRAFKGDTVEFVAIIIGGKPPYHCEIDFGDGKRGKFTTSNQRTIITHHYDSDGNFETSLNVKDSE